MIAKLKGIVDSFGEDWLIVDVGGVGYLVHVSTRTLAGLASVGEAVELLIDPYIREDKFDLFGFQTTQEKDLFRLLQTVQGVGAKVALAILGAMSAAEIETAIAAQDSGAFTRISGIGKKIGERIVNELKSKVSAIAAVVPLPGARNVAAGGSDMADAVSALVNLGYRPSDAHSAVARASTAAGGTAALDDLIKGGLKELAQ